MPETQTAGVATEMLSLQARLEQLEAAIAEAHATLNRVSSGRDASEKVPTAEGAMACANRCQSDMNELNQRLRGVADIMGLL